jgi:hypothetical protein
MIRQNGGKASLDHRPLVDELEVHHFVGRQRDRRIRDSGEGDPADTGRQHVECREHLGGGTGARQRDDGVVGVPRPGLGGVRRVRRTDAGMLAQHGDRLGDELGCATSEHQDVLARAGERGGVDAFERGTPDRRLALDLIGGDGHRGLLLTVRQDRYCPSN